MKYEKAREILPEALLKEVQKYAAGKLLYIPSLEDKKNWGEASGYRQKLLKRNQMICNKYSNGMTIGDLAEEYFLSIESIKKIVYTKKKDGLLEYEPTLSSAVEYSDAGMLEEWLHTYLMFACDHMEFSEKLREVDRYYYGPVKLPLRLVREGGNADHLYPQISKELYDALIGDQLQQLDHEEDLPPLIIHYESGKFTLSEQKVLYDALRFRKINAFPVIIWITGTDDYKIFNDHYGGILRYIRSSNSHH